MLSGFTFKGQFMKNNCAKVIVCSCSSGILIVLRFKGTLS